MEHRFEELLETALYHKATDLHFNVTPENCSILLRGLNGLIRIESRENDDRLFNYLQYMANLDVTCLNKPQSGAFSYFFHGQYYDFRFAVIQTSRYKNGVLRILNCHQGLSLSQLTDDKEVQNTFSNWLNRRSGLILFTGLTGSGKTTTLYSLLKLASGKTIYSIEDPIEVVQDNIIQLEVNDRIGFGYNEGIKQILRHNPDIIMIGEIRDSLAANMAVRSALTGHLVVTSLHSFSCIGAIGRMIELGVEKAALRSVLRGVSNQRLFRDEEGKRTGVYECLDENGIAYWFEKQCLPEGFKDIETKMAAAASGGLAPL